MRILRTHIACVGLTMVLAVTVGPAVAAQGEPPHTDAARMLTLITGDRVTLVGTQYTVLPGKGREQVSFHGEMGPDGHQYLVPADAAAAVRSGRLDRRLFDLTELMQSGYDDASRPDLPVIVTQGAGRLSAAGVPATAELPSVQGAALRMPKDRAVELWPIIAGEGSKIWLDRLAHPTLEQSVPQIGAPAVWEAGYTGQGVKVAVLDTGIDAAHPDFAGRLGERRDFTGGTDTNDTVGHGTHVASTIAGSGAASGGRFRGVAPDATLLVGKVCVLQGCPMSAIIAGMQWAAEQGAAVVNLSLGAPDDPTLDPMEQAVEELTASHGTLFVVAAGNSGPRPGTVGSPGSAAAALTVGAVDKQDRLAPFSSRGPRGYDQAIKPDITAPGVGIVAARAADGVIGSPLPGNDRYLALSGTSMAAPHVAGGAALLAERHPDWRSRRLKSVLTGSARPDPALTPHEQGAGRVDVATAVTRTGVVSDPAGLTMTGEQWPHHDDAPVRATVTYHNLGPSPVTLDLTADVRDPAGSPAPAGMFTVTPDPVTVPAGGQASVTVVADTRLPGPDGAYSGTLLATGGGFTVRTTLALDKEVESYNFAVRALDRTGHPTDSYSFVISSLDRHESKHGTAGTLRLPKGRYFLWGIVQELSEDGRDVLWKADMVKPLLDLTGNQTLMLDARVAKPVRVRFAAAGLGEAITSVGYWRRHGSGSWFGGQNSATGDELFAADLGPQVPETDLVSEVATTWYRPGEDGGDGHSGPAIYQAAFFKLGRYFTGLARTVGAGELAVAKTTFAASKPGSLGIRVAVPQPEAVPVDRGGRGFLIDVVPFMPLPHQRTEHYFADGVRWQKAFAQLSATTGTPETEQVADPVTYRPGSRSRDLWNAAVFAPGRPDATRTGNHLHVDLPHFSDQAADHTGSSPTDSARTTLYRDGAKVAESTSAGQLEVDLPEAPADYRLETEATRSRVSDLSTRINCVWTFRSGKVPADRGRPVGLTTIRFAPELDGDNAAPGGRLFVVPLHPSGRLRTLTVEVSYDDGATWRRAAAAGAGERWLAILRHPAGPGLVSLRVSGADPAGGTVQETVIRAYRLR